MFAYTLDAVPKSRAGSSLQPFPGAIALCAMSRCSLRPMLEGRMLLSALSAVLCLAPVVPILGAVLSLCRPAESSSALRSLCRPWPPPSLTRDSIAAPYTFIPYHKRSKMTISMHLVCASNRNLCQKFSKFLNGQTKQNHEITSPNNK